MDDEIKFKWKKFRRVVLILCIVEFLGLAGVLAWHGRKDEIKFLSKDFFGDYSVSSCAKSGDCFFSTILLELARCILFILFYLVGRTKTLALLYIVCVAEGIFSIFEGTYGYISEGKIFLDKTILLSWTLFISIAYVAAVLNIKYQFFKNVKENLREKRRYGATETPRVPKGFRGPIDEEVFNLIFIVMVKAPINIQENSPLLKSLEHSVILRSSNIIEDRLARSISKDEVLSVNYDNDTTTFVDDATMYSAISQQKPLPQIPREHRSNKNMASTAPQKIVPSIPRLVALMLHEDGIPVKDIKYRFKMYKSVFTGADAVTWLNSRLETHAKTRQEGVALCQNLLESGYIDDVNSNNPVIFEDSQTIFYRFSDALQDKLPVHSLEATNSYSANISDPSEYNSAYSNYNSYNYNYNYRSQRKQPQISESAPSVESGAYRRIRNDNNEQEVEEEPTEPEVVPATEAPPETPVDNPTETLTPTKRQSLVEVPLAGEVTPPQTPDINLDPGKPQFPARISPSLQRFVAEMRNPADGISIKDRRYYVSETQFTTYKKCFVASEAVDWLMNKRGIQEREHAVKILQKLMAAGVIQHVQDKTTFQDDPNFFLRFKDT